MSDQWGIRWGALIVGLACVLPGLMPEKAMPQALAVDIQHMKRRIDNTVNRPEQQVAKTAEKIICKQDKKPVCYANGVVAEDRFMLVRVHRPQGRDFYMLFYQNDKQWKPIYSRPMTQLDAAQWQREAVAIPPNVAKSLIRQLQAL